MSLTCVYLEHALVPQARRVVACQPAPIRALAPDWRRPFIAVLDGRPVLRADWDRVPAIGQTLAFVDAAAIPQGGDKSNPLLIVAMLAVAVFAPQIGMLAYESMVGAAAVTSTGYAIAGAAATFVGAALVNALIPPPRLPTAQQSAQLAAPSPTYSLQAQGNQARLEAAIPEHFGRLMGYPDFAALPYVEYAGNEQYLYQLLCIGRGEYDLEAIRVEDTDISNFDEIDYEVIAPGESLTLFPANVVTSAEVSGQDLTGTETGPFVANAAGTDANYLGIDYVLPRGLYYVTDEGNLTAMSVVLKAEARAIDDDGVAVGAWATLGTETITAATTTPQRVSFRYAVAAGRYEVRVSRTDTEQTGTRYGHDAVWSGLRAYLPETRDFGDVTLLALRMRATNNLSLQASRKINVIATRRLPAWNGSTWDTAAPTRSIAWAIAYAAKQMGLTDAQIDLAELRRLDAVWSARGDSFDGRFDAFGTFWEAAGKIAAAGRAKPYMQAGIVRVMRDEAQEIPVQMYGMRNIARGSFSVDYLMPTADTADAIDVGYFDAGVWAPRRVRARLEGSSALRPAKVDLFGVTSRDQAFREGMYLAASNRLRRRVIRFATEMEGFIPSLGDYIIVQHDMTAWGQHAEAVAWDVGTLTLTVSEPLTWGVGTHYAGLRTASGGVSGPWVVTMGATADALVFEDVPDLTLALGGDAERTHVAFGLGEAWRQPARVLAVRPRGLHLVEIEAINEDAGVHTAEMGEVAPAVQYSGLANYSNYPRVAGLSARSAPNDTAIILLTWQPSPWADHYLVEVSNDRSTWTRVAQTGANNIAVAALYGNATIVRVAAVGLARGPWVTVVYGDESDYMWDEDDTTLMWSVDDTTLMWRY
jgi:hypothetical protein